MGTSQFHTTKGVTLRHTTCSSPWGGGGSEHMEILVARDISTMALLTILLIITWMKFYVVLTSTGSTSM